MANAVADQNKKKTKTNTEVKLMDQIHNFIIVNSRYENMPIIKKNISIINRKFKKKGREDFKILVLFNGIDPKPDFPTGDDKIQFFLSQSNLGCAGGRNFLLDLVDKGLTVILDDDAKIDRYDIDLIENALADVDIIAGGSTLANSGKVESAAYPYTKYLPRNKNGLCARFTGVAAIFSPNVIDKCGVFANFYPYGYEDTEFSFRAIQRGLSIKYAPDLFSVVHYKGQGGVIARKRQYGNILWNNKLVFINSVMPFGFRTVSKMYWTLRMSNFPFLNLSLFRRHKRGKALKVERLKYRTCIKIFKLGTLPL